MKHLSFAAIFALVTLAAAVPAQARVSLSLGVGGCCGYAPYYSPYYYGYPAYYGYPTYVQPPPTVIYTQPAPPPVTYVTPAPAATPVAQDAQTYTDAHGRTCRPFQSTINGAPVSGTACLQPDGSWRTIGE